MKKRLSHFAYNERSRSSWTLTIPHFTPLSPIRSTIKTVTYVPGTFVTLVSGPHKGGRRGISGFLCVLGVLARSKESFQLSVLCGGAHRAHDINVTGAHTKITAEADAYFLFARIGIVAQQFEGRQDHPRRAKAALQRMVLLKCQL